MSCFPSEPAIPRVSAWYAEGGDPVDGLTSLSRHIRRSSAKGVWIHLTDTDAVAERASFLRALAKDLPRQKLMRRFPLFGIPFAVKDNMDVKGLETTAACPAYAYTARSTAFAVQKLLDAGAVLMGKTNMDQFATGLVGTRSPYGPCPNAINSRYISGGSSSGSAHAVARGYVSFALGTDTAGSGRIPAALNNIVCLKPTPGLVSIRGIVPACPSLDCVAVLALSCGDCLRVFRSVAGVDEDDIWSRTPGPAPAFSGRPLTVGIPDRLEFFGNTAWEDAFRKAVARLAAMGWKVRSVDFAPYEEAASMLYFGPYMAERTSVLGDFVSAHREECDPTVAGIICVQGLRADEGDQKDRAPGFQPDGRPARSFLAHDLHHRCRAWRSLPHQCDHGHLHELREYSGALRSGRSLRSSGYARNGGRPALRRDLYRPPVRRKEDCRHGFAFSRRRAEKRPCARRVLQKVALFGPCADGPFRPVLFFVLGRGGSHPGTRAPFLIFPVSTSAKAPSSLSGRRRGLCEMKRENQ